MDAKVKNDAGVHAKLAAFEAALAAAGLTGWLLPKSDRHLGEYNPAHEMRLQFLTGFSGSAGFAVVLGKERALFVDGRYTIQARQEVDQTAIGLAAAGNAAVASWLAERLSATDVIGYDPWLQAPAQLRPLAKACKQAGATLKAVASNPVDCIWGERPAAPTAPAVVQEMAAAGETWQSKVARVAAVLKAAGCRYLPLTQADDVCWLLNIRGGDIPYNPFCLSYALVDAATQAVTWFVAASKVGPEVAQHLAGVTIAPYEGFSAALASCDAGVLWLDQHTTPAAIWELSAARGFDVFRGPQPVVALKAAKNATEIAGAAAAHRWDGVALVNFFGELMADPEAVRNYDEVSVTELLTAQRRLCPDFRGLSFGYISGYGAHGAIVHYRADKATAARLGREELYLLDSGGQYLQGTTDVTRTVTFGEATSEQKRHYTLVLKGHLALGRIRFPEGTSGHQLDAIARQYLWQAGLNYAHGTGHGVGSYLAVHEGPQSIAPRPLAEPLVVGMIVSNEPGFYLEGAYGIRIENLQVVEPASVAGFLQFRTLTLCPYDKNLIEMSLLTPEEVGQIKSYYDWIQEALGPQLTPAGQSWLAAMAL